MAWKGLHLTKAARLSLADGQCCVRQEEDEVRIAIEDLAWIVIDTQHATLTQHPHVRLHGRRRGDHRHRWPSYPKWAAAAVPSPSPPGRDRETPDERRAKCSRSASGRLSSGGKSSISRPCSRWPVAATPQRSPKSPAMSNQVTPTMSKHGQRASIGGRLFADFVRGDERDRRNKLLNYGYAVVRAGVARALVAAGLVPALGLFHQGAANAFNLADDLFEPFRPFVDRLALRTVGETDKNGDLTIEDRRTMAGALLLDARTGSDSVTLLVAAESAAQSLVRAFEDEKADRLVLPEVTASPEPETAA